MVDLAGVSFFHFCSPIPSGVFAHVVHLLRVKSGDSLAIVPAQTHANIATLVVVFHVANSNRLLRWTIKLFFILCFDILAILLLYCSLHKHLVLVFGVLIPCFLLYHAWPLVCWAHVVSSAVTLFNTFVKFHRFIWFSLFLSFSFFPCHLVALYLLIRCI